MSSDTELYKKAIKKWGIKAQLCVASEELAELIVALQKYLVGKGEADHVEEEIADCFIMLEQLQLIFDEENIGRIIDKKKQRLREILDGTKDYPV